MKPGQWWDVCWSTMLRHGAVDVEQVQLLEAQLEKPLHWRKPRRIVVNLVGDTFHEKLADAQIDRMFAVMALCQQHTFIVPTKRFKRAHSYLSNGKTHWNVLLAAEEDGRGPLEANSSWPLSNVQLLFSASVQTEVEEACKWLRVTPASVRGLSLEPLLGAVDLWVYDKDIDWCVVGGESGPGARPMHPDWARSLRDQCAAAGVPLFFKQWGEWCEWDQLPDETARRIDAAEGQPYDGYRRVGKRAAGHMLDGREHLEVAR